MTAGGVARRAVAAALAAAVLAAGGVLLHSGPALAEAVQVWRGYYTLVVSSDSPVLLARLEAAGLRPVVAAAGAGELVTTFRGYELVPVADLDLRLDRLDPRYDPYLQAVGEWFAAAGGSRGERIVYVTSSLPPASFAAHVARALSGTGVRWQIAGLPWRGLALALLLYVAAAAALIVPRRGAAPRGWRAVLALPWLFLVAQGGLAAAFAAIPAYLAVTRLAGCAVPASAAPPRPARRGGPRVTVRAVFGGGLVVAAAVAAVLGTATAAGSPGAVIARCLAIGSVWSAALAACAAVARARPVPRRTQGNRAAETASAASRPPLAARLCGAADPPAAGEPVTLAAMARAPAGDGLPALADYVTHVAYQQTLAVGRPYRLPAPGERVTVDHFRRTADGRVAREQREVVRFTEDWLAAVLADATDGSVASLRAAAPRRRAPAAKWRSGSPWRCCSACGRSTRCPGPGGGRRRIVVPLDAGASIGHVIVREATTCWTKSSSR